MTTMREVAEYAKVSMATVSRVLNKHDTVDPVLRDRVLDAIKVLRYQPNRVARRLRAGSEGVIGLIISDIENPFFISVVRAIENVAYDQGMSIVLCNSDEDIRKQQQYINILRSENVAGLIISPCAGSEESLDLLAETGVPVVVLDRVSANVKLDSIGVDNFRAAYDAVSYLISLGHTRIAFVRADANVPTVAARQQGFHSALRDAGIEPDPDLTIDGTANKQIEGSHITAQLIALSNPPTALFCGNNVLTLGALNTLHEHNWNIPRDISVLGFDDMPWAPSLYPPLTTVAQPTYKLGFESAQMLLARITNPDSPARVVTLEASLVIRQSCAPPPVRE